MTTSIMAAGPASSAVGAPAFLHVTMMPVEQRVAVTGSPSLASPTLRISLADWLADDADLLAMDAAVHEYEDFRAPFCLELLGGGSDDELASHQILTRYQRLLPLPVPVDPVLRCVLPVHRALFALHKPLVRADYDHAIDTWRWLLQLDGHASVALQLAAQFHDIERLYTEADARHEHRAADYLTFKRQHARAGADVVARILSELGLSPILVARTARLVENHEQPHSDPELSCLNDVDSLSVFSLNSWGFYHYFGDEHTRKKVLYTLRRMRVRSRLELASLRHHPRVLDLMACATEEQS